jgi:hypothetical protein
LTKIRTETNIWLKRKRKRQSVPVANLKFERPNEKSGSLFLFFLSLVKDVNKTYFTAGLKDQRSSLKINEPKKRISFFELLRNFFSFFKGVLQR